MNTYNLTAIICMKESGGGQPALLHGIGKLLAGLEFSDLSGGDGDGFAGFGISSFPGGPLGDGECAQIEQGYFVAPSDGTGDCPDDAGQYLIGGGFADLAVFCYFLQQITFVHVFFLLKVDREDGVKRAFSAQIAKLLASCKVIQERSSDPSAKIGVGAVDPGWETGRDDCDPFAAASPRHS
jgi:hypothetical protein